MAVSVPGAPYAYVELVFSVDSREEGRGPSAELDAFPDENGLMIISRKIMPSRSVSRINDETVTTARTAPDHRACCWISTGSMSISPFCTNPNIWRFWTPMSGEKSSL